MVVSKTSPLTTKKGFRVNNTIHRKLEKAKRRIARRLKKRSAKDQGQPTFSAKNIHYEVADRVHGIACGGIGAIHLMNKKTGFIHDFRPFVNIFDLN